MDGGHVRDWILVPTEPIRVRVDARGYEPAWYSEGNSGGQPSSLRLAPRQVLTITTQLGPAKMSPGIPLSFCCYPSSDFSPYPAVGR